MDGRQSACPHGTRRAEDQGLPKQWGKEESFHWRFLRFEQSIIHFSCICKEFFHFRSSFFIGPKKEPAIPPRFRTSPGGRRPVDWPRPVRLPWVRSAPGREILKNIRVLFLIFCNVFSSRPVHLSPPQRVNAPRSKGETGAREYFYWHVFAFRAFFVK